MRFHRCEAPFSTADGEAVELHLVGDDLEVRFRDFHGRPVRLHFPGTVAFRWDPQAIEGAPRGDEPYEVFDSPWVAALVASGERAASRHFKLCFNAASVLDVVALDLEVLETVSQAD